jgi:nitroreductase
MDTFKAIESRRAVKAFDPDYKMTPQEKEKIFTLAQLAPTAFNIQHWRFVTIDDPALRTKIREVAWNQPQVTDSSLLVILCADTKSWEKDTLRYWASATKEAQDFLLPAIDAYYRGKERVQLDEVHRSCGMAGTTIMLAARAMDYDTCPMDGFDYEAVGKLINLPDDHVISFMIAIGKKMAEPYERPPLLPAEEIIISNKFS